MLILATFICLYFFILTFSPMRFDLLLTTDEPQPVIPVNYPNSISTDIGRILASAEDTLSTSYNNDGHTSLKNFKLFTFSSLITPFHIRKEKLLMKKNNAHLTVAFHLPDTLKQFIRSLFINREITIGDKIFTVQQVKDIPFLPVQPVQGEDQLLHLLLSPLSPLIVGKKNDLRQYDYLPPDHPSFIYQLLNHWKERYHTVYPEECIDVIFNKVEVKYVPEMRPFRSRKLLLQTGAKEEMEISGFERFALHVFAPKKVLELAGNAGLGLYNTLGMGCVRAKELPGRQPRR